MPLRHAVRALCTRPQPSLVAVALLALGIGANTTLFALADATTMALSAQPSSTAPSYSAPRRGERVALNRRPLLGERA